MIQENNLAVKLLAFQKKVNAIQKDGKNPHFKSSYATLNNIISEVKPLLNESGLLLSQPVINDVVHTTITHATSGEAVDSSMSLPVGLTPQQLGSAITYYRRYLLAGLLSLEMEDDDANSSSIGVDTRAWLNENTPPFKEAVKFLQGGNSIEAIEKKYKLSKTVREKLLSEAI